MNIEFIWQSIGFVALIFVFLAFKETQDRKLIIYLAIGSWIWWLHFSALGLYAAAGINFFDVFKNLIALKWKKNNYWITFFITSYVLIGVWTYHYTNQIYSFLPTITSILWVLWVLYFRWIRMRLFLISTLFIWFIYNYIGWSIAWMVSDIALIIAMIYGIYKIKSKKTFRDFFPLSKSK